MAEPMRAITPETLRQWLESGRRMRLLDVRRGPIYAAAPDALPGAAWRDPFAVGNWAAELDPSLPVVLYCVHGHEISQNAAMALAAAGFEAYTLAGGIEGWREAGGPTVPRAAP